MQVKRGMWVVRADQLAVLLRVVFVRDSRIFLGSEQPSPAPRFVTVIDLIQNYRCVDGHGAVHTIESVEETPENEYRESLAVIATELAALQAERAALEERLARKVSQGSYQN